jgi:hypothetical protein
MTLQELTEAIISEVKRIDGEINHLKKTSLRDKDDYISDYNVRKDTLLWVINKIESK